MTDRLPVCAEGMNRLAQFNDGVLPSVLAKSGRNREILVFRGLFHTPRLWNRRNAPAGWLSSMTAWTSRPLAGMGKSIPSCRGEINRVFQPPPQLQMVGISSRGRKQGCFQPCRPSGAGPRVDAPDSATMRQARRSSSAKAAKYIGWVTALGRRAGETEVKRTAGDPGRDTAAQPPAGKDGLRGFRNQAINQGLSGYADSSVKPEFREYRISETRRSAQRGRSGLPDGHYKARSARPAAAQGLPGSPGHPRP